MGAGPGGTSSWSASVPSPVGPTPDPTGFTEVEYVVQAVDENGNVAVHYNKRAGHQSVQLPDPPPLPPGITSLTVDGPATAFPGVYGPGKPTVTVTAGVLTGVTYTLKMKAPRRLIRVRWVSRETDPRFTVYGTASRRSSNRHRYHRTYDPPHKPGRRSTHRGWLGSSGRLSCSDAGVGVKKWPPNLTRPHEQRDLQRRSDRRRSRRSTWRTRDSQ